MSVDLKRPKGRKARKARQAHGPVKEFRCQFCQTSAPVEDWAKDGYDPLPELRTHAGKGRWLRCRMG